MTCRYRYLALLATLSTLVTGNAHAVDWSITTKVREVQGHWLPGGTIVLVNRSAIPGTPPAGKFICAGDATVAVLAFNASNISAAPTAEKHAQIKAAHNSMVIASQTGASVVLGGNWAWANGAACDVQTWSILPPQ